VNVLYVITWYTTRYPHDVDYIAGHMDSDLENVGLVVRSPGTSILLVPLYLVRPNFWGHGNMLCVLHKIFFHRW